MGAAGRQGRGERARVAARVRALVDADAAGPGPAASGLTDRPVGSWLPSAEFERHELDPADPEIGRDGGGRGLDRYPRGRGPGREGGGRGPDRHDGRALPESGWRTRLRWDPGRRGAIALGGLLVVAVAATGWWLAASHPREVPISGPSAEALARSASMSSSGSAPPSSSVGVPSADHPASDTASAGAAGGAASGGALLVVDVAGKVRHPGLYRLPAGARVYDAVRAAGGARTGVSTLSLNLAEPLQDGEQVVVGASGHAGTGVVAPGSASAASSAAPTVLNLNRATLDQLETLPGVGPVLGQHILDWRDTHGRFASVDQLREVSGIGDVRLAQLRPLVTV